LIHSVNKTEIASTEALCIAKTAQCTANKAIQEINNTNDILVKSIQKEKENFNYLNCKINSLLEKEDSESSCSSNKSESNDSNYLSDSLSIHSDDINLDYLNNKKHKKHKKHKKNKSNPCLNPCLNPCSNPCSNPCFKPQLIYVLKYTPLQRNVCNYVNSINPRICNS
jgi:hypothetical protein